MKFDNVSFESLTIYGWQNFQPSPLLKESTRPGLNNQILAFGKPGCILRERIGGRWRELIGLKLFSGRSQLAGNLSTPKTRQAPVTFCNGTPHWSSQWCTIAFSASWQRGRRMVSTVVTLHAHKCTPLSLSPSVLQISSICLRS